MIARPANYPGLFSPARPLDLWAAAAILIGLLSSCAVADRLPITMDDLIGRAQLTTISLSPDGNYVAYLSLKAKPLINTYEAELHLNSTRNKRNSLVLSRYRLSPDEAFELDTGGIRKTAGQFVWSTNSRQVAYTTHCFSGMQLRVRSLDNGEERIIMGGYREIEIASEATNSANTLTIDTIQLVNSRHGSTGLPTDFGLLIKDGYRFYGPLSNPKLHPEVVTQRWAYDWHLLKKNGKGVQAYRGFPEEWKDIDLEPISDLSDTVTYTFDKTPSPGGSFVAMIEDSFINLRDPDAARRRARLLLRNLRLPQAPQVIASFEQASASISILGWRGDGKELYYVIQGQQYSSIFSVSPEELPRAIFKDKAGLAVTSPGSELSRDGRTLVLVRSTNTSPDELLKVDLQTGAASVLASPNRRFAAVDPVIVRFMTIDCCGGGFYGRLYLPKNYRPGIRYPLVFTDYVSTPGFYASVGDEVPIIVMVEHGIAVFALHSKSANILSRTGDFRFQINRVDKPLRAMEWVRSQLAVEGIIDPDRCGLTGVSYGSEIAMYAYWKSKMFRAISVATTSWEPMNYFLAGVSYSKFLDSVGLSVSDANWLIRWKQLAVSLNVGVEMPPLLVQSPDDEEYFGNIQTWLVLRRRGLPVEWLLYPHEGHVKRGPSDRWWVYQRNLDWFRFWLQNWEDPDPMKAEQYTRWRTMRNH